MTGRSRAILKLLSENSSHYTTIDRIAGETGAGIRTIHRDLEGLERSLRLRGVRLERRRGYGIRLIDPLPEQLAAGLMGEGLPIAVDTGQRPMLLLIILIASGNWVKLAEISSILFVSDSTVSTDLNALETWLPSGLKLERLKGTGVRLTGDEMDIRFLFLSLFPSIFPYYIINNSGSNDSSDTGESRLISALEIRARLDTYNARIAEGEKVLGLRISAAYRGFLYCYLFLLNKRLVSGNPISELRENRTDIPEMYMDAAVAMIAGELPLYTDSSAIAGAELSLLARILTSCEVEVAPESSVGEYLGDLSEYIEAMIEHSLSRLEGKERIWLHDDRKFLNYMRLVIAAAAHRIDLGMSSWWEYRLTPFPGIHETPESAVLVSQFLSDLGPLLREPDPAIVRREISEAALAVAARLEDYRTRSAYGLRIKILCYEGLGMSSYILALARDVFPGGAVLNNQWEPDFERSGHKDEYDLVVSTFPMNISGNGFLLLNGNDSPETIRKNLRKSLESLNIAAGIRSPSDTESRGKISDKDRNDTERGYSLSEVMTIIRNFVIVRREPEDDLILLAATALDRGDCDIRLLAKDLEKRESYGSLVFEELGIRVLHCRSDGVPTPRAGVIQDPGGDETVLLLSAPIRARQTETHALSEIVIALTEVPDLPRVLAQGSSKEIKNMLMTLFGQRAG